MIEDPFPSLDFWALFTQNMLLVKITISTPFRNRQKGRSTMSVVLKSFDESYCFLPISLLEFNDSIDRVIHVNMFLVVYSQFLCWAMYCKNSLYVHSKKSSGTKVQSSQCVKRNRIGDIICIYHQICFCKLFLSVSFSQSSYPEKLLSQQKRKYLEELMVLAN